METHKAEKLPISLLKDYGNNVALVRYNVRGEERQWFITAYPDVDDEDSLRKRLRAYHHNAVLTGWVIKGKHE